MTTTRQIDWDKVMESGAREDGLALLPVVIQDVISSDVLMLVHMDRAALAETERTGKVTVYSRKTGQLRVQGESSNGCPLEVAGRLINCEGNSLVLLVQPAGDRSKICHHGGDSCFG